jgi:hypothetical protein
LLWSFVYLGSGTLPRPAGPANGSATRAALDQPASALVARSGGGGSQARVEGRGSPALSSDAAGPAATPARTDSAQRLSSPTIRLYPQRGFSSVRRTISSRSERSSGGRPGFRCAYLQRRAMSWRCHRSSVSGLLLQRPRRRHPAAGTSTARQMLRAASRSRLASTPGERSSANNILLARGKAARRTRRRTHLSGREGRRERTLLTTRGLAPWTNARSRKNGRCLRRVRSQRERGR